MARNYFSPSRKGRRGRKGEYPKRSLQSHPGLPEAMLAQAVPPANAFFPWTCRRTARFWSAPVLWRFQLWSAGAKATEDCRSPRRSRASARLPPVQGPNARSEDRRRRANEKVRDARDFPANCSLATRPSILHLHITNLHALLERSQHIGSGRFEFLRHVPFEASLDDGLHDRGIIQLLGVVDLVPAGHTPGVIVGDVLMVLADRADDIALHDLHVVDVIKELEML